MNARGFFLCSLLLLFATGAHGSGTYQRTRDGECLVWNASPGNANEATWSGKRDSRGFATGDGVITWYKVDRKTVVGSLLPSVRKRPVVIARYSGQMVKGKLEGPVVDLGAGEKKFHATFFEGNLASDWLPGAAPTSAKQPSERPREKPMVEAPSEGPTSPPSQRAKQHAPGTELTETPSEDNDSLQSLVGPPSSLRMAALAESSRQAPNSSTVASPPSNPPALDEDAKAVGSLDTEYQAAVKANDAATMDRILADDFVLVTGRGRASTKADLIKEARDKQITYEHQDEQEGTQNVRVWGDTAVVTALLWVKGTDHGQPIDRRLWFSDTYVRTPAGWRYVFGQASIPLPAAKAN